MTKHHHLGCSKWTALQYCGRYESDDSQESDALLVGTEIHKILEQYNKGESVLVPDEYKDQVAYGLSITRDIIKDGDASFEHEIAVYDDNFDVYYWTTLDVSCNDIIIDYKTGEERDYYAQMAGMAFAVMESLGYDSVTCYVVYTKLHKYTKYEISYDEARSVFKKVVNNYYDGKLQVNDYCKWCKHLTTCEAQTQLVNSVVKSREDWALDNYHSSQITDPEQMAKAYEIACQMSSWAEAVKHHCKALIMSGVQVPGLMIATRSAPAKVENIVDAYNLVASDIKQEDFLSCCNLSLSQLEKKYADAHELSASVSKKKLREKLSNVIKEQEPITYIKKK